MFNREEFRLWLIDRFEPEELLMFLNVSTEDILEDYPQQWEDNEALLEMYGLAEDEEENE